MASTSPPTVFMGRSGVPLEVTVFLANNASPQACDASRRTAKRQRLYSKMRRRQLDLNTCSSHSCKSGRICPIRRHKFLSGYDAVLNS